MRNITLRKSLYLQLVASLFLFILLISFAGHVEAEDLKPIISDALKRGDTALAIDLLNQEIAIDKSYHYNYYTLGMIYYNREQYKKAAVQFNLALDNKSKDYESLYRLGMTQLMLGDIDLAAETFKKGIKKDKKEKHRFEDGMGLVYMEQGKYQDADKIFRQALVGNEDNAMYHIHLGDANFYQGVPYLAIKEYEKALAVDTAGLEVYYHWAEACLEMKDYACAIEKLKIVLNKDSTHAPSWRRAAGIYFKAALSSRSRDERTTRFKETIGAYYRYIELSEAEPDSAHVRTYFELAMAYSFINGFENAVENFEKVLSIPYEPRDIYFNYGKALWGIKDYVKSGEMLLKHIDWVAKQGDEYKSGIQNYELFQLLGDSYYYRDPKDYLNAITYYKKSLEDRSDQNRIVQNIALAYNNLKSYDQAFEYYVKRIELGVDDKFAFLFKYTGNCALAIANSSEGDEEEMMEEEMVAEEPDTTNYYAVAADYLTKYLEFDPSDTGTVFNLASTYLHRLNDCANGVKYYEMGLTLDPNNCDAKKYLGYAYFGGSSGACTQNYTKALKYLKDAYNCIVSAKSECEDVGTILGIAQCYHLRGAGKAESGGSAKEDYAAAFEWYGKVLKCEPNHKDAKEGRDQVQFEF